MLFTFGVLLVARGPIPRRLLVILLLWAPIGGQLVTPWLRRRPSAPTRPSDS